MTGLTILETSGDVTHVAIAGPLDLDGVKAIQQRFVIQTTVRRRPAIVDLSGVESISSLGIGMLVEAARGLGLHGVRMVLVAPAPTVAKILALTKVTSLMPIVTDLGEARAVLSGA